MKSGFESLRQPSRRNGRGERHREWHQEAIRHVQEIRMTAVPTFMNDPTDSRAGLLAHNSKRS